MNANATTTLSTSRFTAIAAGGVFAVTYIAALAVSGTALRHEVKAAGSLLATAAFVGFMIAELRLVRQLDELQRRIQAEALAFAFPVSVGVVMLLGLFDRFTTLPAADLSYRHIWPLMILAYLAGLALANRRYR